MFSVLKALFLVFSLSIICFSFGQENTAGFNQGGSGNLKPDFQTINKNVSNPKSNFYLSKLVERYQHSDPTLTLEEFQHLYYGYSSLNPYLPIPHSEKQEKVKLLRNKNLDYITSVEMCNSLLKSDMFDLDFYIIKTVNNYELNRNKPQSEKSIDFYYGLCKAILMSGTGEDYYNPIYITHANHADFICYILGLTPSGKTINLEKSYFVAVNDNMFNKKGVFFEIVKNEYIPEEIAKQNNEKTGQDILLAKNEVKPKEDKNVVLPTQNTRTEIEKPQPTVEHKTRESKEFVAPTHGTRTEKDKNQVATTNYKPRDKKEFVAPTTKRREEKEKIVYKYVPGARDTINEEVIQNREMRDRLIAEKLRDQELAKQQRQKELEQKLALRNKIINENIKTREKSMTDRKISVEKFLKERDLLLRFKEEEEQQQQQKPTKYY